MVTKDYFANITVQEKLGGGDFRAFLHCRDFEGDWWEIRGYGETAGEAADNAYQKMLETQDNLALREIYGCTIKRPVLLNLKLWLDDIRPMPDDFDIHCKTVEEALYYVKEGRVRYISFDNDLGEGLKEGYDLAKIIEELAYTKDIPSMEWNIHSANPRARVNIEMAMKNADKFWEGY